MGETKSQLISYREVYKGFPKNWIVIDNKIIVDVHTKAGFSTHILTREVTNEFIYEPPKK